MVQFWKTPSDLREFIQQRKSTLSKGSFRILPRCLNITLTQWHDFHENGSFQRAHSLYIWGFKGVVIIVDLRGISTRLVTVGHSAKSPKSSVLTPNWILIPFYLICFVNIHHHVPSLRHFWRSRFFIKKTGRKTTKHIGKRHNSSCGHRGAWLLNACKSTLRETLLDSRLCYSAQIKIKIWTIRIYMVHFTQNQYEFFWFFNNYTSSAQVECSTRFYWVRYEIILKTDWTNFFKITYDCRLPDGWNLENNFIDENFNVH